MAVSKTPVKKSSLTAEIIIGQAAQNITKAINELKVATDGVSKLSELGAELTLLVANKEEELASLVLSKQETIEALEVQYKEKDRQLSVDLDLSFKSNTEKVVSSYLTSIKCESITTSELISLRSELELSKSSADSQTKKEVAIVVSQLKTQYENEIKLIHSENKAVAAENAAKINTLDLQNKFMEDQTSKLFLQLEAERSAGVERARAGSIGTITVGEAGRK